MADELVAVQSGKDADYLGTTGSNGVLRVGSGLKYTLGSDGGNEQHATLDLNDLGSANKLAYWSGTNTLTYDTNLHWDGTNDRLGVRTGAPNAPFHVVAAGTAITDASIADVALFQRNGTENDDA